MSESSSKPKLTPKQEKFCQVFILKGNASEAYRESYRTENMKETTIHRAAFALLHNSKITARLNELREIHLERHFVDIDELTQMYMATYHMAHAIYNPSAASSALNGMGKLHGLMTDKVINEHTGTIAHQHDGVSRTLEILGEFKGSRPDQHTEESLPN